METRKTTAKLPLLAENFEAGAALPPQVAAS
jgi:hypothetical protein